MSLKAHITPEVLEWTRKSANISLESAASKVPCSVERLEKWEKGEEYPTINHADQLANIYKRPLAVFFLTEIPDFKTLRI